MGKDNKLHIILLGRRNSGKSSLINALTGQNIAIVSDVAGTTTDLVKKSYEIPDFASVIFIDTAGIDDTGALGEMRVEKTRNAISQADMALLVVTNNHFGEHEQQLAEQLKKLEIPFLVIHNKRDESALTPALKEKLTTTYNCPVIDYSTRKDNTDLILNTLKSVKSPKDIFFPQSENLYTCEREGRKLKVEPEALKEQKFTVFGMRACDVQGVKVLDQVFLADPVDSFYAARREHGTIVAMACHEPEDSCFCKTFGIDAAEPAADVAMWQVADGYAWEAKTEKGQKLTELVKAYLTEQDLTKEVEAEKEAIRTLIDKMPNSNLSLEGWGVGKTKERFDDPKWKELSDACLGCGTCTFSCPTCQCYDIKDFNTGNGVQRYRCWDSCMYSDFTMMAAGNNRTTQLQRFRQRFMHKLVYFPDNNDGMYSCVGCGRCVEKCPQSLNIVKVIKRMGGTK